MARGWESKSVEDQIVSAEEGKATRVKPAMSAGEREAGARKAGLLLSRTKILGDLENARAARYRAMLQQSLEYIDAQIGALSVDRS
jgi:hypothetical protein